MAKTLTIRLVFFVITCVLFLFESVGMGMLWVLFRDPDNFFDDGSFRCVKSIEENKGNWMNIKGKDWNVIKSMTGVGIVNIVIIAIYCLFVMTIERDLEGESDSRSYAVMMFCLLVKIVCTAIIFDFFNQKGGNKKANPIMETQGEGENAVQVATDQWTLNEKGEEVYCMNLDCKSITVDTVMIANVFNIAASGLFVIAALWNAFIPDKIAEQLKAFKFGYVVTQAV